MKNITLPIIIEADADGFFVSCPALQGSYSQGDTYEEALANIKDAIKLHIEDRAAATEFEFLCQCFLKKPSPTQ